MRSIEQCGYVIRYGSFQAINFSDRSGNNRHLGQSWFINTRRCINSWMEVQNEFE